ncbi:MAG TPA: 3-methyl-2-oxobutanoate hydroxymethyltransferase [Methylococcaceae bacterium]|nr:3-methyl-2-oxobutanoate hydroxymethyltransferase [Methylococcaceae bacterium]
MTDSESSRPLTLRDLAAMKQRGEKIASLTCYDAAFAAVLDSAGVDVLLVGDSLGMTVQGRPTTLPVTLDAMAYHTACVDRGRRRAFLIADLPFMSYQTFEQAGASAARLLQEGGAQMVKLEGGAHRADTIRHLAQEGVPVCAHLGLLPQSIHRLGGYRVQGRGEADARRLLEDAVRLQDAGASLLVLECIPALLAEEITLQLDIPTIGIGAGGHCDGQVLVLQDVLGLTSGPVPRYCKNFLGGTGDIRTAIRAYVTAVRAGEYPAEEHCY